MLNELEVDILRASLSRPTENHFILKWLAHDPFIVPFTVKYLHHTPSVRYEQVHKHSVPKRDEHGSDLVS